MPSEMKGTAIQIYLDWLKVRTPEPQVAAILAQLEVPTRAMIVDQLLPSVLYPYSRYAELLVATKAVLGDAYERLAFDHGRYAAEMLLGGVYRLTLKVGNVERTLHALAHGWRVYFDTGVIEIREAQPSRYVFLIKDATYHPLHPPISAGYVQRACELAGAAQVDVDVRGAPPEVEMVIAWS
jgi:hypothetical protein